MGRGGGAVRCGNAGRELRGGGKGPVGAGRCSTASSTGVRSRLHGLGPAGGTTGKGREIGGEGLGEGGNCSTASSTGMGREIGPDTAPPPEALNAIATAWGWGQQQGRRGRAAALVGRAGKVQAAAALLPRPHGVRRG